MKQPLTKKSVSLFANNSCESVQNSAVTSGGKLSVNCNDKAREKDHSDLCVPFFFPALKVFEFAGENKRKSAFGRKIFGPDSRMEMKDE